MPLTLEQYAAFLAARNLPWPAPPAQQKKPSAKPHVVPVEGLKIVTWNIYGTLLAISGGELRFELPGDMMEVALDKTVLEFKMWGAMSRKPGKLCAVMKEMYKRALDEQRMAPSRGEKYPEILSDRIWEATLKRLLQKDYKYDTFFYGSLDEYARKIAYFFHRSLQGVVAQPGAGIALEHVRQCGLKQGCIADGQFFTPMQLNHALKDQSDAGAMQPIFDPDAQVLSFDLKARKPSKKLFEALLKALEPVGIAPFQVLHVGSRIEQDIIPARRLGMRTALYAGDAESLRATPAQLKDLTSRPDVLITDLEQIRDIIVA